MAISHDGMIHGHTIVIQGILQCIEAIAPGYAVAMLDNSAATVSALREKEPDNERRREALEVIAFFSEQLRQAIEEGRT